MKEAWIPRRRDTKDSEETSTGFLNRLKENPVSQKYAVRAAVLFAIAFPGCSIFDHQEPTPTITPSPTPVVYQLPPSATFKSDETPTPIPTLTPEPIPTPTPTTIPTATPRPTETPRPTPTSRPTSEPKTKPPVPTKTPEPPPTPTLTPTPEPTRIPTPTPTPTPTPSPTPTPTQVPKIELKPGEKLDWVQPIENKSHRKPLKRSIDLEFPGGDEGNLKIEIRVPLDSDNIIPEGDIFNVPPGGVFARITAVVLPGASPTCFDSIDYKLQSEEEGRGNEPLARVSLDRNICIPETLLVFFSQHKYHEKEQLVISRLHFYNLAGTEQKTWFWVDINKCSYPIAEREFISGSKKISPDEPVAIPAESIVTYVMRSTPPADEKPSSPYCLVRFERILEK